MKIIYLAKHNSGGNDDEGAITHAFRELGHEVVLVSESKPEEVLDPRSLDKASLILFHKWCGSLLGSIRSIISSLQSPPRIAFWHFDLIDFPSDPTLHRRCSSRINWMANILPQVDYGFCTDGDWIAATGSPKLHKLEQGFDTRLKLGKPDAHKHIPILFTGIARGGGVDRCSFVEDMGRKYGSRFHHVTGGVYGQDLANLIASSDIVVAPDSPCTDKYWSNRVYLTCGLGGFMIHPYSHGLALHYKDEKEIVYYSTRYDLYERIAYYLERPNDRAIIATAGRNRTLKHHSYLARCRKLLQSISFSGAEE